MSTKAAILPPIEPGRLSRADVIKKGRRSLFSGLSTQICNMPDSPFLLGPSDFLQFVCCVLPGLVLFYGVAVAVSTHGVGTAVDFGSGLFSGPKKQWLQQYLLARSMGPLLVLIAIGLLILIVDMIWSTGECTDFIIQTTTATVQSDSSWQWLWVLLNCCASAATTLLLVRLQPWKGHRGGEYSQSQWSFLIRTSDGSSLKQAIGAWAINMRASERSLTQLLTLIQPALRLWRINMDASGTAPRRSAPLVLLSWILHLPVLCVAMGPSAGYVSC